MKSRNPTGSQDYKNPKSQNLENQSGITAVHVNPCKWSYCGAFVCELLVADVTESDNAAAD